jgi:hypothetical protein
MPDRERAAVRSHNLDASVEDRLETHVVIHVRVLAVADRRVAVAEDCCR